MKIKDKKILNEIKKARVKNNSNWMDLLRIAIKANPKDTKKVLKNINNLDKKISSLLNKLANGKRSN